MTAEHRLTESRTVTPTLAIARMGQCAEAELAGDTIRGTIRALLPEGVLLIPEGARTAQMAVLAPWDTLKLIPAADSWRDADPEAQSPLERAADLVRRLDHDLAELLAQAGVTNHHELLSIADAIATIEDTVNNAAAERCMLRSVSELAESARRAADREVTDGQ